MSNKEELIERYLEILEVPDSEKPLQRAKFGTYNLAAIKDELSILEDILEESQVEIEATSSLWEKEEAERHNLINASMPEIREWLMISIQRMIIQKNSMAFAPFQDVILNKSAFRDFVRLFYAVPTSSRENWRAAFVDVCAYTIENHYRDTITEGLLDLVNQTSGLGLLAAKSGLAPSLLAAHGRGLVQLPPRLLLDTFETACAEFEESWLILSRYVDHDFAEALATGDLADTDFDELGRSLENRLSAEEILQEFERLTENRWLLLAFGRLRDRDPIQVESTRPDCGLNLASGNVGGQLLEMCAMIDAMQSQVGNQGTGGHGN